MTHRRCVALVAAVWVLSLLVSVAPMFGWRREKEETEIPNPCQCSVNDDPGYAVFSATCSFYLPLVLILVLYQRIYVAAVRQSHFLARGSKTAASKGKGPSDDTITLRVHTFRGKTETPEGKGSLAARLSRFKREKKASQTLALVVGTFVIFWLPFFFILPLGALCESCRAPDLLFRIVFWLGYCNSMCNPVIYAHANRDFRRAFQLFLRCAFHRRREWFSEQFRRSHGLRELNRAAIMTTSIVHSAIVQKSRDEVQLLDSVKGLENSVSDHGDHISSSK